jgi:hypothetical protein
VNAPSRAVNKLYPLAHLFLNQAHVTIYTPALQTHNTLQNHRAARTIRSLRAIPLGRIH